MGFMLLCTLCIFWGYICGRVFYEPFAIFGAAIMGSGLLSFIFRSQGWM